MCAIDTYRKHQSPIEPENVISGGGSPLKNNSSTQDLAYIGNKLNFINQWLKCFGNNYYTRVIMYNDKI